MTTKTQVASKKVDVQDDFVVKLQRIRSLVPDNVLTEIDALASFTNQIRWRMGDAVNKVKFVLEKTGQGSFMDACWFVCVQAGEFRSQNTLRRYAEVAAFYPKSIRRQFRADEIPFSHFTFAKSLEGECRVNGKVAPRWAACLTYSIQQMQAHGFHISVDELERRYKSVPANGAPTLAGQLFNLPVAPVIPEEEIDEEIQTPQATPSDMARLFTARVRDMLGLLPIAGQVWSKRRRKRVKVLLRKLKEEVENEDTSD